MHPATGETEAVHPAALAATAVTAVMAGLLGGSASMVMESAAEVPLTAPVGLVPTQVSWVLALPAVKVIWLEVAPAVMVPPVAPLEKVQA